MVRVLLAHEIAKTCFLIQALLYRAVARLPLQIPEDEAIDPVLTPEECRVAGLQPDPKWEEIEKGEDDERLLAVIALPSGSDERKRLHEERIKWKAVQEWRRTEWNHGFQELLKRHHNEFLMALVEGRLRCQGQRSGLLTKEDIAAGASWQDIPWEEIPSTFWSSCEIDWEKNRAKGGYCRVQFDHRRDRRLVSRISVSPSRGNWRRRQNWRLFYSNGRNRCSD